ncbi:MAG: aminopeptidase P family protein [Magnetospirillum sp. WYHS-4]
MNDGGHDGGGDLERLLAEAGSPYSPAGVRDIVRGVLAASTGRDGDAWTSLIAAGSHPDLEQHLLTLKEDMAAGWRDGLAEGDRHTRLVVLRTHLEARGLHGFIVPRADEHQGEYVPRRSERLAWLTGFTGSAGVAVVLRDRAALFVDGRYTLQAAAEVDGDDWRILHLTDQPPDQWLAEVLDRDHRGGPAAPRLGYDPWLHTPEQVERYKAACEKAGGRLVPLDDNPIDAIWRDQPPPPLAPVVPHPPVFAGRDAADKLLELASVLGTERQDAVVLTASDSIAWLFNIRGGDVPHAPLPLGFAIVMADASARLFMDPRKLTPAVRRHLDPIATLEPVRALATGLARLGLEKRRVRLDNASANAWIADRLLASGAAVVHGSDPCALPKARKNPAELKGIRAAHRRDGVALVRFLAWLAREAPKGEITEMAAARHLESLRSADGSFRGPSFPTIAGAGPNGAIVHYRATEKTDRLLEPGGLFLVDSGGQYPDGTTDVTRTVAIGTPTDAMRDHFTRVLRGHIALASARFPKGTAGSQLDALARRPLWEAGLDYDHGTGHGVGCYLSVHEGPQRISKLPNRVPLEPGMVLSDEPGYYKAGAYGIRIENLMVVKALGVPADGEREMLGFEILTLAPVDRAAIAKSLMSADEILWLDAYHARVRETLGPLLDAEAARWLEQATLPL